MDRGGGILCGYNHAWATGCTVAKVTCSGDAVRHRACRWGSQEGFFIAFAACSQGFTRRFLSPLFLQPHTHARPFLISTAAQDTTRAQGMEWRCCWPRRRGSTPARQGHDRGPLASITALCASRRMRGGEAELSGRKWRTWCCRGSDSWGR